jgi:cytochrome c oxidase subunit 2
VARAGRSIGLKEAPVSESAAEQHWDLLPFPDAASTFADKVDPLFLAMVGVSTLIVVVIFTMIVYYSVRYRRGSSAPRHWIGERRSHWIELIWAVPTLLVFLGFFAWGARTYLDIYGQPPPGENINVIAKQWMWKFEHPDGVREINELHVPAGRSVTLRMTSQDVIHSLYAPAFRLKRDVLPDAYSVVHFTATKPGTYALFCAEYCGLNHSRMGGAVIVMTPGDYQDWLTSQPSSGNLADVGAALFRAHGCSGCHIGESVERAPTLAGIYGRPIALSEGSPVIADDAYLRDSILYPDRQIAAGYAPIMPSFKGQISEGDLLKIIAYIKALKPQDETSP